jgi:hypothetical protein
LKICTVSEAMGWSARRLQYWLLRAVKSRGAVSPAARATARSEAVTMPGSAVRRTTLRLVRQAGTPSASEASRSECGTSRMNSSVDRARGGIITSESAQAPASAEKCPSVTTSTA